MDAPAGAENSDSDVMVVEPVQSGFRSDGIDDLSGIKPFFFSSLRIKLSALRGLIPLGLDETSSTSPAPGAALRTIGFSANNKQGLRANNRAENLHQPVRRRELRKMGGTQNTQVRSALCSFHAAVSTPSMFNDT